MDVKRVKMQIEGEEDDSPVPERTNTPGFRLMEATVSILRNRGLDGLNSRKIVRINSVDLTSDEEFTYLDEPPIKVSNDYLLRKAVHQGNKENFYVKIYDKSKGIVKIAERELGAFRSLHGSYCFCELRYVLETQQMIKAFFVVSNFLKVDNKELEIYEERVMLIFQAIAALVELASLNLSMGTISPENIIKTAEKDYRILDLCNIVEFGERISDKVTRTRFTPPELASKGKASLSSDSWGWGMIVLLIWSGSLPDLSGLTQKQIWKEIDDLILPSENKDLNQLIRLCLVDNPNKRFNVYDILTHSFFVKEYEQRPYILDKVSPYIKEIYTKILQELKAEPLQPYNPYYETQPKKIIPNRRGSLFKQNAPTPKKKITNFEQPVKKVQVKEFEFSKGGRMVHIKVSRHKSVNNINRRKSIKIPNPNAARLKLDIQDNLESDESEKERIKKKGGISSFFRGMFGCCQARND